MSNEIKKEDLFNVIKQGHAWHQEKIEEEIKIIIASYPAGITKEHYLRWSDSESIHYIYDNDCYLEIFNRRIQIRGERENVSSSGFLSSGIPPIP
jgi:hypothetical protein